MLFTAALSSQTKTTAFVQRGNSVAVAAGMGVHLVSAPEIVEYINASTIFSQRIDDFGSAVDFFGDIEIPVTEEWGIKIEHSFLFKSYSVPGNGGGTIDFFYAVQLPSVLVQRIYSGYGYFVKIGAGGGYHFGSAEQRVSTYGVTTTYTATGIGLKTELVGQTAFDEDVFAYIGGSLGWEFIGDLKEGNGKLLTRPNTAEGVSLRYFHAGVRFGITYYL